ncbi:MAG TPA: type II secretion system F family protein [Chthoniobacteraceae bacterium]|jgi:type II secretory pathway component PulF
MPDFRYVARSADGKLTDGVVTSHDRAAAIFQIEQQRCVPIKIEPVIAAASGTTKHSPATKGQSTVAAATAVTALGHTHLYLFTEQLAHLLGAGMTLDEALGVLVKRLKHPKLGGLSQALHQALIDGRSLSQAMREYPRIFSPLYVNMVSAGEASGSLSGILRRLTIHLADVKALRDRVQQALIYPAMLVVFGIGLIIVFMQVMVPQLTGFFAQTGSVLPLSTRILLESNRLLGSYWWLLLLLGGGGFALFRTFTQQPDGRLMWDRFKWRFPVFSLIIRYRFYAQFARTLGTLTENGVTLLRALELLEEISGNEYIRRQMVDTRRAVVDGATLSTALGEQKIFPELFLDMMAVGEQTGKFGETMLMIADVYERELDKQVKVTTALIPPLVMLGIASVIGLVVFGILSAVFSLTQGLRTGIG